MSPRQSDAQLIQMGMVKTNATIGGPELRVCVEDQQTNIGGDSESNHYHNKINIGGASQMIFVHSWSSVGEELMLLNNDVDTTRPQ